MYEVAQVAGNKIEAALALQNLSGIMGQTASTNHQRRQSTSSSSEKSSSSSAHGGRSNKLQHRHSTAAADKYHGHQKVEPVYKVREVTNATKRSPQAELTNGEDADITARPVTISEMNAYNAERSGDAVTAKKLLNSSRTNAGGATSNSSSGGSVKTSTKKKEFYTVGEGYHKTDSCYYKTPDGGYHKLPPDSYHKMSEVCYNKMPDGSFRRLDNLTLPNNMSIPSDGGLSQQHHKVRNQIIRFLKRSKSHTPATIKEMQKTKEKEREHRMSTVAAKPTAHHTTGGTGSRKVVVTMMENGLPIVATSHKSNTKREHSTRDSTRGDHHSKHKVN